ncbi:EpsG family protein [Acinetobacter sp. SA01]|uniref:EpsG family protein n=1 Tax=Acinetobacter sp. SA01 TaxID=1862567 RepID=UPI00140D6769|nr:EpsG family protein [Acinetobacter sp. SA01]
MILYKRMVLFFTIFILSFFINQINWFYFITYDGLDNPTYVVMLESGAYDSKPYYTILDYFKNEWLWSKILTQLEFFFSAKFIFFDLFPFLNLFFIIYLILKKTNFYYIFWVTFPYFILFWGAQLRSAFAVSLFYCLLFLFNALDKSKYFIIIFFGLLLSLIHTSILFFSLITVVVVFISNFKKMNALLSTISFLLIGVFTALITGPYLGKLLENLDDRRQEIYSTNLTMGVDFKSSFFWGGVLILLILGVLKNRDKEIDFAYGVSLIFISSLVITPFIGGGYAYRYLMMIFPFVIIAISNQRKYIRILLLSIMMIAYVYLFFVQLNFIRLF